MKLRGFKKSDGSVAKIYTDPTLTESDSPADAASVKAKDDQLEQKINANTALAEALDERVDELEAGAPSIIAPKVTEWLNANVNPAGSAVTVDSSLTIAGSAADAKKTGDELSDLKSDLSAIANITSTGESQWIPRLITGYHIDKTSGELNHNASTQYAVTDLIEIVDGISINVSGQLVPTWSSDGWVTYASDGETIIGHGAMPLDTSGAKYFRLATYNVNSEHSIVLTAKKEATFFVTPQQYGAKADGTNDDTNALQAAINSGKRVILPSGSYLVSEPLAISKQGVVIEGENNRSWGDNKQCAEIVLKTSRYMDAFFVLGADASNFSLKNIALIGDSNTLQPTNGIQHNSTGEDFVSDLMLENVSISYCNNAINIDSTFKSVFKNVRVNRCRSYGFKISGKTSGEYAADGTTITMINCYATLCTRSYMLERIRYSTLINCASDEASVFDYSISTCSGISFINCGCELSKGNPLFFQGTNANITINGLEVIASDELSTGLENAVISCYGLLNCIISGVSVVGGVGRQYDILNKSPSYTSVVVLDDSIDPTKCSDITNNCIKFTSRQVVLSTENQPSFIGQIAVTSSGVYIADYNKQWSKVN